MILDQNPYPLKIVKLARYILGAARGEKPFLVGIDGLAGSGKTTFCMKLAAELRVEGVSVATVSLDDSYWTDVPRDVSEVFHRSGNFAGQDYDWRKLKNDLLSGTQSAGVVLIEGCFCLRRELSEHFALKVFVHSDREECLRRAIARDGDHSRSYYENYWKKEEDFYLEAHDPMGRADLIVDTAGEAVSDGVRVYEHTTVGRALCD